MISRISVAICVLLATVFTGRSPNDFSRYKKVEAYEVRAGVLVIPRYAADGELCEMSIQRLHYSEDTVNLTCTLKRQELLAVINELIPQEERGKRGVQLGDVDYLSVYSGETVTAVADYEKVSIQLHGSTRSCSAGDVVATISWKAHHCR